MWLSDLNIVLPDQVLERGSIEIDESTGTITNIVEGSAPHADVSAPGLIAIPGLVDMHGDMIEREVQPRPNANIPFAVAIDELDKRLVGCGITTHYAAIAFEWDKPKQDLRTRDKATEIINAINAHKENCLCDMRVHARFEISNPYAGEILIELVEAGQIDLVSVMDHAPGQGQFRDIEKYIDFIKKYRKEIKGEAITDESLRAEIKRRQEMPKAWDVVQKVSAYTLEKGLVLASHDDDTVEKVGMMADFGVAISEFPVTAEAAQFAKEKGIHTAMGAPNALRGNSLSGNLSAFDAVTAGLCDTLATDYHPASMIHAMFKLVKDGSFSLNEAAKIVSTNPAQAMGLDDRGTLEIGKIADIVLVNPNAGHYPRVHGTLRAGEKVYWDKHMHALERDTKRIIKPV